MEVDDPELKDEDSHMQSTFLCEDQARIAGSILIEETRSNI